MRRNTSKAALYESIMRRVTKQVKDALNESKEDMEYHISEVEGWSIQDDWAEGELPNTENCWDDYNQNITTNTINEAIDKFLKSKSLYREDVAIGVRNKKVCVEFTADENGCKLTPDEEKMWKQGKFKAYTYEYSFRIWGATEQDLYNNGLEDWN